MVFHILRLLSALGGSDVSPHFSLRHPSGETMLFVNKTEAAVSAICYCPQLCTVLVGYNFGAFQMWNLSTMSLVYTSPVFESHTPILYFAFQVRNL